MFGERLIKNPELGVKFMIAYLKAARFYNDALDGQASRDDGVVEDGIAAQAIRIYENINILLAEARMDMSHVVKIISYLVDLSEQPAYAKVRNPYLGDARPAMTLIGIAQLAQPALRLEVEVIAAKHD